MKIETIQGITLGMIIALGILFFMHEFKHNQSDRFKISELSEGVGYQICTESTNTQFIYCNDVHTEGMNLYWANQSVLDKFIEECPNAIITSSTHCIGEYLEIRGNP